MTFLTAGKGRKVLVVGLDGATFDLLDPWLAEGRLPHLQQLIDAGSANVLHSTFPPVTPVAWASFMTGCDPDRHGILGFQTFDPRSRQTRLVNARDIEGLSLWRVASALDKRVCIINVPMTYPPEEVNGCLISGMDTPSLQSTFTHPPLLGQELLARFPDYDFVAMYRNEGALVISQAGLAEYLSRVRRVVQVRAELAHYLLCEDDWDFCVVQFQSTDRVQHLLWDRLVGGAEKEIEQIASLYTDLDALVGRLVAEAQKRQYTVLVVSDHGFGQCYGSVAPNALLRDWGYLALHGSPAILGLAKRSPFVKRWLHGIRKRVRFFRPQGLLDKLESDMRGDEIAVDWEHTRALVTQGDLCGYLYLNAQRYRADGLVTQAEYEPLRRELQQQLVSAEIDGIDAPIFRQVLRAEQVFPSLYAKGSGPDLVLVPQDGYIISCGLRDQVILRHGRGTHRPEGVFVAAGPGIRKGVELEAGIADIAPTVLALMGLPVPREMDGRVLAELLQDTSYDTISADGVWTHRTIEGATYTNGEQEVVVRRLRELGYLS